MSKKRMLNFAALAPKRDVFADVDGKEYEFRAMVEFGAVDLARIKKLQQRLETAIDAMTTDASDEEAAASFETATVEALKMILPEFPEARLNELTLGQKAEMMQFWRQSNRSTPEGEAKAGQNGS